MGRWRTRLLFGLIAYCGGFATAIYALAPAFEKNEKNAVGSKVVRQSGGDAGQVCSDSRTSAAIWKDRMQNVVSIAEEQACKAAVLVKAQLARMRQDSGQ